MNFSQGRPLLLVSYLPYPREKRDFEDPHAAPLDARTIAQFLCECSSLAGRPLGEAANLIYKMSKDFFFYTPTEPLGVASRRWPIEIPQLTEQHCTSSVFFLIVWYFETRMRDSILLTTGPSPFMHPGDTP